MEQQWHDEGSYFNPMEAEIVVKLVSLIRQAACRIGKADDWFRPEALRVITFYQGQVECIKRMLHRQGLGNVLVSSVDSSQGCEANIVILSFVRSNKEHVAGFLKDERRLNVSLTRAKYQLFCIGNARGTLSCAGVDMLKRLVDNAIERNCLL
jgi:superfamily I DNA and/or RNA helicase